MTPRPLRVAMVAASPRILGGHSVQADTLTSCLAADGVVVERIAIDRRVPAAVQRVRGLRTCVNEACYAAALRAVRRADVVHAFSASYWSFLLAPVPAMMAGRMAGARVVLHYHSGELADHLERWGWRVHPWLKLADEIVVCSEFQRRIFGAYGHRSRVVPNVIDLSRFGWRAREPLAPRFVSTRNLEPHYGVDVVLEAFAWIRERHPQASIVVAGSGSQESRLRAQATRMGTKGIRFAGPVKPADMPALLDAADILLNASSIDNQPVSVLEAQAAGLAVVSTGVGGIPEMVDHGRTGLLAGVGNARELADAACALLAQPAWAARMARAARDDARRFSWEAVRPAWRQVYGPALTHAAPHAPARARASEKGA